jgi:hypothetical protein
VSARDTGVDYCGPTFLSSAHENAKRYNERTHVPPGCDASDGPGGRVYVIEVRGCRDHLLARYDAVGGEGADGWVVPASEEAEPLIRVCWGAVLEE